jgi:hypothetical protein
MLNPATVFQPFGCLMWLNIIVILPARPAIHCFARSAIGSKGGEKNGKIRIWNYRFVIKFNRIMDEFGKTV